MPTATLLNTTGCYRGTSSYSSSASPFMLGKTTDYTMRGRVGFAPIEASWYIKSIKLYMNRTDGYAGKTLKVGTSLSSAWGAALDWSQNIYASKGTGAKAWDLTAYKDILQGYADWFYFHFTHGSGDSSYCEWTAGSGSGAPRLVVEYEDATLTVPGDALTIDVQSAITVGISGSGLTHKLSYAIGTASGALAGGGFITAGSTVNWTPDAALANQITDGMVGDVTFTLESYLDGVLQSTRYLPFPLNVPASYVPTIASASFALQNTAGDTIGVYVQNQSRTVCTILASSVYGASIVEYRLTIGGKTYVSSSSPITSDVLTQAGVLAVSVTVVDSRGQTAVVNNASAATVYEYFAPMITAFSLLRCTSDGIASNVGTYIKYVLNVVFAPINNLNAKGGTVAFKVAGAPAYGDAVALSEISAYSATVSGVIGGGSISSAGYVVAATLTDRYTSSSAEAELARRTIYFDLHSTGEGMAIGKVAETASLFDVGLASRFRGAAQFDVAPVVAASQISSLLATLMPVCTLYGPTKENVTVGSNRCWFPAFQTVKRNDNNAYGILLGGSTGTRQIGFVIPADGYYRVTYLIRLVDGSASSKMCMRFFRFSSAWTPPAANYLYEATAIADANFLETALNLIPAWATSNTTGEFVYDFSANAGDKIWPTFYHADTTKNIEVDSFATIQRIG